MFVALPTAIFACQSRSENKKFFVFRICSFCPASPQWRAIQITCNQELVVGTQVNLDAYGRQCPYIWLSEILLYVLLKQKASSFYGAFKKENL